MTLQTAKILHILKINFAQHGPNSENYAAVNILSHARSVHSTGVARGGGGGGGGGTLSEGGVQ